MRCCWRSEFIILIAVTFSPVLPEFIPSVDVALLCCATKRSASSLAVTFDPPHCYSNKLNATLSVARNHEIIMMIK